jgi:hypothetical protein
LYVKASDVDRSLSKGNIIKRFGEFKSSRIDEPAVTKFGAKKSSLWDEYQDKTKTQRDTKKELLETLSNKSTKVFKDLKDEYSHRRELIKKNTTLTPQVKRIAYRILSDERTNEFKAIKEQFAGERNTIFKDNQFKTYANFLTEKAAGGDMKALKTLQSKKITPPEVGNVIELADGEKSDRQRILPGQKVNISKRGVVFYNVEGGKIIETAPAVKITKEINSTNIKEFLNLAKIKFGTLKPVVIRGSETFKKGVEKINKTVGMKIKEEGREQSSKPDTLDQIKQRIGEKHNATRGFTANSDAGRFDSYITSTRAYFDGVAKQLENVIGRFRDIGRTGSDTIRERIVDVFNSKDRSIGTEREVNAASIARAATDRERNGALQSSNGKGVKTDRPSVKKKDGLER